MSNPTLAQVRAALKTRFEQVANIGKVNDYERYATQMSDLKTLYVAAIAGNDQLRGLYFRRASTAESYNAVNRWVIDHNWLARLFMALDDSAGSEKTFDDLIEAIRDNFRANPTIVAGGAELITDEERSGVQVPESGPMMFAGVLCHGARLTLTTRQFE